MKSILLTNDLVAYVNDFGVIERILDMSIPMTIKPSYNNKELFDKYQKLREELSKKTIYKNKQYGLFVDYNALNQMYGNPTQSNMNY